MTGQGAASTFRPSGFDAAALAFARSSIVGYAILTNPRYQVGRHHRVIASVFERVVRGEARRVMIFAPPRHGKSQLVSIHGPAWALGNRPDWHVITASHTAALAERMSGQTRNLIGDDLHAQVFGPAAMLRGDTSAKADFALVGGGEAFAVGVGGTPIGRGANLVVIDDPVPSREAAESERFRKGLQDWYQSTIYTRLQDDGAIILMHQRWHDDDLAGWLLREHADENWLVINMPAIWDEDAAAAGPCILGRSIGDALWPEKYPVAALEKIRAALSSNGPRDWESMYQQRPRPAGGAEMQREWFKITRRPLENHAWAAMNRYLLVDPADEKKKKSDWTAAVVIGLAADQNFYLLDAFRDRLNLRERTDLLFRLHRKWRPIRTGYEKYGKDSEIQHIEGEMDRENYRFPITPLGGSSPKNDRIRRMIPHLEASRWWFPSRIDRVIHDGTVVDLMEIMIEHEAIPFPAAKHDDFLDACSRIYDLPLVWPAASNEAGVPLRRYRTA